MDEQTEKKPHLFEKGNQAARKHGYYSDVLDSDQLREYEEAINVEGLDEEIALMRVKIKSICEKDSENLKLLTLAINALVKMIIVKYGIDKNDKKTLVETVGNIFKNYGFALGIAFDLLKK
jgi:hypothetical protein